MRVALVSEHASPLATLGGVDAGGQNVHVGALATDLARRGDEVVVYTRRDDPDVPRKVEMVPRVTVQHVDAGPPSALPKDELFPYMPEFAQGLHRAWRRWPPDVVHAHFWMSGWAADQARREPGDPPLVQTFHALGIVKRRHQGDRDTSPPQREGVERGLLRAAHHIIATCSDEVFELVRLGGDPHAISVVPCGVDLDHFTPHVTPEPRRPAPSYRLVVVSRLVERKGVGNVITALTEVPDTELVVAGGPEASDLDCDPEVARLRKLARGHGVADRVHFRGRVARDRLPALLRSADAVVCVPWYEPFGIVPLEAMACGVPVVASAVGGMIDTVVDGIAGIHVPPRRPDVLAEALRSLLADPARRSRLGAGGLRRARKRYGWPRVAESVQAVYLDVAEARHAVRRVQL